MLKRFTLKSRHSKRWRVIATWIDDNESTCIHIYISISLKAYLLGFKMHEAMLHVLNYIKINLQIQKCTYSLFRSSALSRHRNLRATTFWHLRTTTGWHLRITDRLATEGHRLHCWHQLSVKMDQFIQIELGTWNWYLQFSFSIKRSSSSHNKDSKCTTKSFIGYQSDNDLALKYA